MKKTGLILSLIVLLLSSNLFAYDPDFKLDTNKVYEVNSIKVSADRMKLGLADFPTTKGQFNQVLNMNGFSLIRKGTFFAQDIYADGFKRADITVVVDGERYHSACPNRMDSPLTRVNPLEMDQINLSKSGSNLFSGLGGGIQYHRAKPTGLKNMKVGLGSAAAASNSTDATLSVEYDKLLATAQYSTGKGYEDGDGNDFVENYGYEDDFRYQLAEFSVRGLKDDFDYRAAFTYTDNVMFPYLKMDERVNRVYSSYIKYKKYKLYFNYTDHMMDNDLRVSPMYMISDAKNYTVGLTNDKFELFLRNWDTENRFDLPNGTTIENHMVPDVSMIGGTYSFTKQFENIGLMAKTGLRYVTVGDEDRLSFFEPLYGEVDSDQLYYHAALSSNIKYKLAPKLLWYANADITSVEPEIENLYISVQKPMMNPYWLGNPNLDQPIKVGFRSGLNYNNADLNLFVSHVWNYVNQTSEVAGMTNYQTYENIDALLLGFNFSYRYKYFATMAGYTYGKNRTSDQPLSEIPPFFISSTFKSPRYKKFEVSLTHTYNDAQTRVDSEQDEEVSPSWHKLDANINYFTEPVIISLKFENLTDETYYHHLSYQRSPFSAGFPVNEPGFTIRLNLMYNMKL